MRVLRLIGLAAALALTGGGAAAAQGAKGPPNALQGFSKNRDEPVHIEAATLEVRDKDQVATFKGEVRVQQGDTSMKCDTLVVFYDREGSKEKKAEKSMRAADPGPGGEQKIRRLEAHGSVVVSSKDQTATGKTGIFDMPSNTVTLTGDVVMTQGQNILRGDKLVVNLSSGVSRVEGGKNGRGRVEGLFIPGGSPPGAAGATRPAIPGKPF
jgi:lipopolysaccharide export system protein LptA